MKIKLFRCVFLLAAFVFCVAEAAEPAAGISLYSEPSKKELFAKARDVLKESLKNKDKERAKQAFQYLQDNVKNGAPLMKFEEYLIHMELGEYEQGIFIYAELRRTVLDSTYTPKKENRIYAEDPLHSYLFRNFNPFTKEKADSLIARVNSSDVKQQYKDLYAALVYSELVIGIERINVYGSQYVFSAIKDTTYAENFLTLAKNYTKYDLSAGSSYYLKNQTIPFVQGFMDKYRDFRKDPLKHKYYTGGLGIYAMKWVGFLSGDAAKYLNDKMGDDDLFLEAEIRYKRFSVSGFFSYGLVVEPNYKEVLMEDEADAEDESIGLTLGFTVFDSRFLRATPFIGIGSTTMLDVDGVIEPEWILGLDGDIRLLASKPRRIGGLSVAMLIRAKYMAQIGHFSDDKVDKPVEGTLVNHTFALGIGIDLW